MSSDLSSARSLKQEASESSTTSTDTAIRLPISTASSEQQQEATKSSATGSVRNLNVKGISLSSPPAQRSKSASLSIASAAASPSHPSPRRNPSTSRPPVSRKESQTRIPPRGKARSRKGDSDSSDTGILSDGGFSTKTADFIDNGPSDDEVQPVDKGMQLIKRRNKARKKEQKKLAALAAEKAKQQSDKTPRASTRSKQRFHPLSPNASTAGAEDTDFESFMDAPTDNSALPAHSRRGTAESDAPSSAPMSPVTAHLEPALSRSLRPGQFLGAQANTRRVSYAPSLREVEPQKTDEPALSEEDQMDDSDEDRQLRRGGYAGEQTDSDEEDNNDDVEYTLKDRQDAINIEHPFGLPIWKPALYKKSRSVTRNAETALHLAPSSAAEKHFLPGNVLWTIMFGSWLALTCFVVAALLWCIPWGGSKYGRVVFELGSYLFWPFGRYVEGWDPDGNVFGDTHLFDNRDVDGQDETDGSVLADGLYDSDDASFDVEAAGVTWNRRKGKSSSMSEESSKGTLRPEASPETERTAIGSIPSAKYGAIPSASGSSTLASPDENDTKNKFDEDAILAYRDDHFRIRALGRLSYWLTFYLVVAPLMLFACITCWALVFPIPMAKLLWALVNYLAREPLALHFRSAPTFHPPPDAKHEDDLRPPPLKVGQPAPKHSAKVYARDRGAGRMIGPGSKILLCSYEAMGIQYYKYTIDGVNILFINLMPVVFFVIFDALVIRSRLPPDAKGFLAFLANPSFIFAMALASVIPLSYFIGMAVASISAQSSIGMGAVINATFGSIIEVILYSIALIQGKAVLVEGSIVGSLLAGVLLMPGISMVSGAVRRKEQKFNARSAGVTSTMLIMAIIGILTPTLFYEIYGTFQLSCDGCPAETAGEPWRCSRCVYEHVDPVDDPFYRSTVQYLSYNCALILVLSYLVGLWFSLRTHASQIWQNDKGALPTSAPQSGVPPQMLGKRPAFDSLHKLASSLQKQPNLPTSDAQMRPASVASNATTIALMPPKPDKVSEVPSLTAEQVSYFKDALEEMREYNAHHDHSREVPTQAAAPLRRQVSSVSHARDASQPFSNQALPQNQAGHGGHDAPNWSRTKSASVLMACTALYALIAEILVDMVDVVLDGSGIPEKFLGITLFALVPNTTEFMNAISFALNGNIALSMEIGSAYALQVCLLQIPAMVAFSWFYGIGKASLFHHAFTLIFPRWDVIAILFSVFLLTYVYLEARANYYRGSILVFSYLVLMLGFFYAPGNIDSEDDPVLLRTSFDISVLSTIDVARTTLTNLWT